MEIEDKNVQLRDAIEHCRELDVDLRIESQEQYFTAVVWEGWEYPHDDTKALSIQKEIQKLTSRYPDLVCYCFDPYSTLVYAA